ncbi:MAG: AI-2E family transporter [Bacillota bacterium]|nr:AI-2E family transporter [Bacillota bacterium]
MNLNRKNIRKIRGLILFTALVILVLMKFDLLCMAAAFLIGIIKPFIIGGMIAFVINIPMRFFETKLFGKEKLKNGKGRLWLKCRRGVSLVLAFLAVILIITLVVVTVIPQLVATIKMLPDKLSIFWNDYIRQLEVLFAENPELLERLSKIETLEIDWEKTFAAILEFLQNGMGSMLTSTFSVASSIISNTVNFFIALVFSVYVLAQKEKLGSQFRRILEAYANPKIYKGTLKVCGLLYRNFSNFITGQCTEAVILGLMFVVAMKIFRFDYAVMVGVLIAFTALIPIVGAFIGCFIGAFLILVDDPVKALWFVVMFIILQQIEGNLIYPHVVGNSVGLPSIWVLAAVTVGGSLMGIVGMLIFIPLLSTVYMLLREDVNRRNGVKPTIKDQSDEHLKEQRE